MADPNVECTFCAGSGYGRSIKSPIDPDTPFCAVCKGDGELTQAELDNAVFEAQEAAAAFDPDGRGDYELDARKDREMLRGDR
jgi:DnaJ-class molecular chaperone